VLGLQPGADHGAVRRSYLERKALYASESVATYTLLEGEERTALLERIEEAYRRIVGLPAPPPPLAAVKEELPAAPAGPPPPADDEPGAHLRHHRLRGSMLLAEVADEIKVRATLLEKLEEEQFPSLPAPVYVRGFVYQYAKLLGLPDADRLVTAYLAKMEAAKDEG
jgi:hypothetical protein